MHASVCVCVCPFPGLPSSIQSKADFQDLDLRFPQLQFRGLGIEGSLSREDDLPSVSAAPLELWRAEMQAPGSLLATPSVLDQSKHSVLHTRMLTFLSNKGFCQVNKVHLMNE